MANSDDTKELDALINAPAQLELSDGTTLDVTPIRVKELPGFIAAVDPVLNALRAGADLRTVLVTHSEALIAATAIGLRVPRATIDAYGLDDLLAAATLVVEVNMDFFVRRVQPALSSAMNRAVGRLAGLTPSSASSPAATAGTT